MDYYLFQTLRRLAQNREAARKSRLRKKVCDRMTPLRIFMRLNVLITSLTTKQFCLFGSLTTYLLNFYAISVWMFLLFLCIIRPCDHPSLFCLHVLSLKLNYSVVFPNGSGFCTPRFFFENWSITFLPGLTQTNLSNKDYSVGLP